MAEQKVRETTEERIAPTAMGPQGAVGSRVARHAALRTDRGNTQIGDVVVVKIAGLAAREIPGVHEMGKGLARALGGIRARVAGGSQADAATQGVSVAVGERQCAVDIDIVTYYGQSIVEVSEAVRGIVIERIEQMTGLEVKEVNISIDDLYVEGVEQEQPERRVE
jgi:uncharacterized alkaline shock family protein YloU